MMMRTVWIIALAMVLGGCAQGSFARAVGLADSPDQAAKRQAALANQDDATCRSYGATPGSDVYVQCRMALDQQRAQQRAAAMAGYLASH